MKHEEKHSRLNVLQHTPEDLRWATHELVAQYRAKRLKCNTIAEIGCGIGFQTIAFAQECEKVYAIEIDADKIARAQKNAQIMGLKNITFIHGDALNPEIINKVKDAEIIFCDHERLPEEKERSAQTIKPNLSELQKSYQSITTKIAMELPPQIKDIPFAGEKEYLSLNGSINRLTVYTGPLQTCDTSAIVLPEEAKLTSLPKEEKEKAIKTFKTTTLIKKYFYEADPAIDKAGLHLELSLETKTELISQEMNEENKQEKSKITFFTSDNLIESPFFKNSYLFLGDTGFDEPQMISLLIQKNAGKVTLRFPIEPQEYWKFRTKIEKQLSGEKKVALFKISGKAVLGEKVESF